jgi:uncharacterized protein (TIGR03084 family)
MQQAIDFLEESKSLNTIVGSLDSDGVATHTQFLNWTIEDIIGHLHMFNHAAELALQDRQNFNAFFDPIASDLNQGKSLLDVQKVWLKDKDWPQLLELWQTGYTKLAESFGSADPKHRLAWAGPDMSVRSSVTARQMETWAHGQAVFDVLGKERVDQDRIKNIVHLGVNTYGWTFLNRKLDVPEPAPFVTLIAPSGAVWEWNESQSDNVVHGPAIGFCQIVTQTRNVKDTDIQTTGDNAEKWMAMAQCFAGKPVDGPGEGERRRQG